MKPSPPDNDAVTLSVLSGTGDSAGTGAYRRSAAEVHNTKQRQADSSETGAHSRALVCKIPAVQALIPVIVDFARKYIETMLDGRRTDIDKLDIVLSEAVTNAIVHGSPRGAASLVELSVDISGSRVLIKVSDSGSGLDIESIPEPDFTGEQTGGRGLYIIRSIMDKVSSEKVAGGMNVLIMEKNLEPQE